MPIVSIYQIKMENRKLVDLKKWHYLKRLQIADFPQARSMYKKWMLGLDKAWGTLKGLRLQLSSVHSTVHSIVMYCSLVNSVGTRNITIDL